MTSDVLTLHIDFIGVGDILLFQDRPSFLVLEYIGVKKHGPRFLFKILKMKDNSVLTVSFANKSYQVIKG